MKKVHIETWGCQMNVADSETMLAMLTAQNYTLTDSADDADLVLLNTCHIREKARHKVVSRLGRLKEMKVNRPGMRIAVAGCVAQAEGKKLLQEAPQIDVLLGPGKIPELPNLLREQTNGSPAIALGFDKKDRSYQIPTTAKPAVSGKNEITRYVNITQGCDNFCTFCVVPHTRGREISRSQEEILAECQNLIEEGAQEITLLGQNVNSYGSDLVREHGLTTSDEGPFVDLLRASCRLPKLRRLRFTTSNPHDFSRGIVGVFRDFPEIMGHYLHLPVQSGDDEVLERMRRKVTVAEFDERVDWLRQLNPEFALSTDLIVGFPGETDAQFQNTLSLIERTRFSFVYAFMYSPRKNTPAARFKEQVPDKIKSKRLAALNELQNGITEQLNAKEIGRMREVLFLYESRKEPGQYYGRTPEFRLVKVGANRDLVGQIASVKIQMANRTALVGELA